jgi:hypothetical protein
VNLAAMIARESIRDCLARYGRGIDRRDRALLESAYWSDATDDHIAYTGDAPGFIDWVIPLLETMELTQHFLGQVLIRLDEPRAWVETYFQAYHRLTIDSKRQDVVLGGRYIDEFEQRGTEWRILARSVIGDWHHTAPSPENGWSSFVMGAFPAKNVGTGDSNDPSIAFLAGRRTFRHTEETPGARSEREHGDVPPLARR